MILGNQQNSPRSYALTRWVAKRAVRAVVLGWIVTSIVILLTRFAPGAPPPLLAHYFSDLARIASGDLGHSLRNGSAVSTDIAERLPVTLQLIGLALLIAVLVGTTSGVLAAIRGDGVLDRIASALSTLAVTVPVFVAAMILMLLFGQSSVLASITMAFVLSGIAFQATRTAVADTMDRDFVRTARAKGLPQGRILTRHVLRNALAPVIAALVPLIGVSLGNTVLVEYAFRYPGVFALLIDAVGARDYPVVAGIVLVAALLFIVLRLAVDLACAMLDPRIGAA